MIGLWKVGEPLHSNVVRAHSTPPSVMSCDVHVTRLHLAPPQCCMFEATVHLLVEVDW